ncbi:MAG: N-acetyltransferase [Deltaproteobacteria bacterium]|nr:N-acetyltransferase [Deltaproteobacteria bacterium]
MATTTLSRLGSMTIREAIDADLPAIVTIYNSAIPGRMATADTQPVTVESRRRDIDGVERNLIIVGRHVVP